jgi:TonB family protein
VFTRVFLKEMVRPGVPVDQVLRDVRRDVVALTSRVGHVQVPALYDQSLGDFYFFPESTVAAPPSTRTPMEPVSATLANLPESPQDRKTVSDYLEKIRSRVRMNTRPPEGAGTNTEARFRVTLLPSGEILNVQLVQSSSDRTYDEALERGIKKSDPLPLPAKSTLYPWFRTVTLSFAPAR